MSFRVVDEVPVGPDARVYAEGWQSWSPTAWWPAPLDADRPRAEEERLMRFRPDSPLGAAGCQGEGLLVVDPGNGSPAIRHAGADATASVASLRATMPRPGVVEVATDGPTVRSAHRDGATALATFGDEFGARAGAHAAPGPRVWCSWYRYFERVTAADVEENLAALDALGLEVDIVQVDDGWGTGLGEGARERRRFGSLTAVVDRIRAGGRRAGLWLAPFLVGRETSLARTHPEWLTGPAGRNWGQDLVGLDLTHPGVRDHLAETVGRVCALGVTYLKLDFLYAGALPGRRSADVSPVEAYRSGLQLVRDAAGPGVYLLGCGAPLLPSVGLVDAMRVAPDTFHEAGEQESGALRGARSVVARAWQDGRLWANDPDCLVMRPSFPLRDAWADVIRGRGSLRSFSDRVAELDPHGLAAVHAHLAGAGA